MFKKIMITIGIILLALVLAVVVLFSIEGSKSRNGSPLGLNGSVLHTCPDKPNCVSTEQPADEEHYVEPISTEGKNQQAIAPAAKSAIIALGGEITGEQGNYISSEFKSSLFGFVDDMELRIDTVDQMLHVRSGSRVGHSDLGINAKRFEAFKTEFNRALD